MVSGPHAAKSKVKQWDTVIRHEEIHMGVGRTDTLGNTGKASQVVTKGGVCLSMESDPISQGPAGKVLPGRRRGCRALKGLACS